MLETILTISASYLWGGIPSAYLAGRYCRGLDIRRYGSGNLGASNVMESVGKWTGLWVGLFECIGKGTLPVMVANLLDHNLATQTWVGLAAIMGHNWSPYMRFTGGRGIATTIGVLLGLLMWREVLVELFVFGIVGRLLLKEMGLSSLIGIVILPVLSYVLQQPIELVYASVMIVPVLVFKRITANWEMPEQGTAFSQVIQYRILLDRDVSQHKEWTTRRLK